MACPTCSETMQNLGLSDREPVGMTRRVFWCPRCGTLREELSDIGAAQTNDEAPKLVARCREFEELVPHGAGVIPLWKRVGIAEAIYPPNLRTEG
jgi:hypothetical protein